MNAEQKQYIEQHLDLIENNQWEKFFQGSPEGVGGVLYEAGIDFIAQLDYIPSKAFGYCTELTSITIPHSVTNIGEYAFHDCYNLASVTIPPMV